MKHTSRSSLFRRNLLIVSALALLGACTVGSDYTGPQQVLPATTAGASPGFARADTDFRTDAPQMADWWQSLNDPVLDRIEQQALSGSPDLAAARARFDQARSTLRLERANSAPSVSASAVYAHLRTPDTGGQNNSSSSNNSSNFYNLGLTASWEIDLFGGQHRKVEAAGARLEAADASVADARVSLTSAVAQTYIRFRESQQGIVLARQAIRQSEALLDFEEQRFSQGVTTRADVDRSRSDLEQARQLLPPLKAQADVYANALAILAGQTPGALDQLLADMAPVPLPPADIAVGDPQALLQRRPDIRVAERKLKAQTAEIGVAEAARFPSLNLFGIIGIGGAKSSDLTHLDDFTAISAPMLQWNFLDFGRAKAQVNEERARRDEAEAQYKSTVLGALRDVEDAMGNFRAARENTASLARAEASAARIATVQQERYSQGVASMPEQLTAELDHTMAMQALVEGKAELTGNFVLLQKALGLGWSDAPSVKKE
ncbi:MAG: efflux transporter outer membrane subunit [Novosphingobium sp.]|nr:efflux transporter outer membrane subunit [Novosphingobium sp.]